MLYNTIMFSNSTAQPVWRWLPCQILFIINFAFFNLLRKPINGFFLIAFIRLANSVCTADVKRTKQQLN